MNYLLDTCTFLWLTGEPDHLSTQADQELSDIRNRLFFSVISAWEIAIKYHRGQLELPDLPAVFIPQARAKYALEPLYLTEPMVYHLGKLPPLHKDPFDRMLVCQAVSQNLTLLTPDPLIRQYPVPTLW